MLIELNECSSVLVYGSNSLFFAKLELYPLVDLCSYICNFVTVTKIGSSMNSEVWRRIMYLLHVEVLQFQTRTAPIFTSEENLFPKEYWILFYFCHLFLQNAGNLLLSRIIFLNFQSSGCTHCSFLARYFDFIGAVLTIYFVPAKLDQK